MNYFLATDLRSRTTFVAEMACRKVRWSAMPADLPGADVAVDQRRVPLVIRRAGRAALIREAV